MDSSYVKSKVIFLLLNKQRNKMKKLLIIGQILAASFAACAQSNPLSLDTCYARAMKQYPLIKQQGLIEKSREYNVSNVKKGYFPQLSFSGQATYQSAVTAISLGALPNPVNNLSFPTPTKDQYNIHGEIDQTIYDGGVIKNQKTIQETSADIEQQN